MCGQMKGAAKFLIAVFAVACTTEAATIYLDQAAFLADLEAGYYLENYSGYVGGTQGVLMNFSQGGFSYTASVPEGLWISTAIGNALSTSQGYDAITFNFTSGNVTAVGGYFYPTDYYEFLIPGTVVLTLSDGTLYNLVNPGTSSFVGFMTDGGVPITSLVVGVSSTWPTVDDFYVGQASSDIPEPSTAGLVGLGLAAAAWFARRRKPAHR